MVQASHYGNMFMVFGWMGIAFICFLIQSIILIHWMYQVFPKIFCRNKKNKKNRLNSTSATTPNKTKHFDFKTNDFDSASSDDMIIENENEIIDFTMNGLSPSNIEVQTTNSPSVSAMQSGSTTPR
eukprot:249607_1